MEILLDGIGPISLLSAELLSENSIEIRSADGFRTILEETGYPIRNAGFERVDGIWYFAAELETDDDMEGFAPQIYAIEVENAQEIDRLKARLYSSYCQAILL